MPHRGHQSDPGAGEHPAASSHGPAVKLPTFWNEQPRVWFAQAEAQFNIHGINSDVTRYHYVIAALDQDTAARVLDIVETPPSRDKYQVLKNRLLGSFALTEYERASRLLHVQSAPDTKPSALMDRMLALRGSHQPCFLFRQIFLEQMPEDIRTQLALADTADEHELSRIADQLWLARNTSATAVRSMPSKYKQSRPAEMASNGDGLCYYHRRFGNKALKCVPPCSAARLQSEKPTKQDTQVGNSKAGCL